MGTLDTYKIIPPNAQASNFPKIIGYWLISDKNFLHCIYNTQKEALYAQQHREYKCGWPTKIVYLSPKTPLEGN